MKKIPKIQRKSLEFLNESELISFSELVLKVPLMSQVIDTDRVLVDVNNQIERILSFLVFVIAFVSAEFGLPLVYAKKTDFFGQSVTTLMPEFSMYNFIAINIRLLIAGLES